MDVSGKTNMVFDPLYGFIQLNAVEWEIIHSPFYQRLRWIKQLGFSCYVFPGAEHSRFGHSIGVLFNAHCILKSCGIAVSDEELFDSKSISKEAIYHKSLRIAALMHDLGTFAFSHTTEMAYVSFGETTNQKGGKGLKDDHENLGSYIVKNTDFEGGITHILKKYGFDPQSISDLIKGVSPSYLANQILHSEVDCDRMDYLLRDAHYTGLQYGTYDRDYLLHHFKIKQIDGHDILTISKNALHCVEDFLSARFAWYSQVIRSARGAKYDVVAEKLTFHLLEQGKMHRYSDLLDMIANDPVQFYQFNDNYFMSLVHASYTDGSFKKFPDVQDMAHGLLFQQGPVAIRCPEFDQRLIDQDDQQTNDKHRRKAREKVDEIEHTLKKYGGPTDWHIADLPKKDIIFVRSKNQTIKNKIHPNVLLERDPVKMSYEDGNIKLLTEVENSIIAKVQNSINFIPNVYCSHSAHRLLVDKGVIKD